MTTKSRVFVALIMASALALGGCLQPPSDTTNPAVLPGPNDNVIRIQIEAVQITKQGAITVTEKLKQVTVNVHNGLGEPVLMGDNLPSTNWHSGEMTTIPGKPAEIILSQAPGDGGGSLSGSLSIESLANSIDPKALVINCRFLVKLSPLTGGDGKFHEDKLKFQTGTGKKVPCLISFQFQVP